MGAGSGLVGKALFARGLALDVVAVDISPAMLELIEVPAYVEKLVADCAATPFADASFEGAFAAGLLEHIVEPPAFFVEVARIVKPRGLFLFSFPPNRTGRTELFDPEQGLVSHDIERIAAGLAEAKMIVHEQIDYPAYLNGSRGPVWQRLVIARRGD
jgi:ubiquinone/menaquinone biosynthesis C-methylase UbiE